MVRNGSSSDEDLGDFSGEDDIDMLESDEDDLQITNPDLVEVLVNHAPEKTRTRNKWVMETPGTIEKAVVKRKTRASKAAEEEDDEDDAGPAPPPKKPKLPKKTSKKGQRTSTETSAPIEETPSVTFRTILKIEKPPKAAVGKGKKAPQKEEYLIREPFEFETQGSFEDYLEAVAEAAPCPREDLVVTGMKWKPEKPKSAEPNPLSTKQGFRGITQKMEGCKMTDRTVILFIQPPRKPEEDDRFWEAAEASQSKKGPSFDFSCLEDNNAGNPVEQQKMKFESVLREATASLELRYPIGNNNLFPDKRIYRSPEGWFFDLNHVRLASWAWHIHNKSATVDTPPSNAHFDASSRIRTIPKPRDPVAASPSDILPPPPVPQQTGYAPQALPNAGSFDTSSMIQLLCLQQMQQMQSFNFHFNSQQQRDGAPSRLVPNGLPRPSTPLSSQAAVCSVPPSPALRVDLGIDVSLEDFCSRYSISDENYHKLKKLEYTPGDSNIKSLPRDEWKEAGFALLTWKKILEVHEKFCRDIKAGLWDGNSL